MKEELLHFIWKGKRFEFQRLYTTRGEPVQILSQGHYNERHSGPDFQEARIRIGRTTWAGHVEIHIRSSDWLRHQHQADPAYANVILHVVWEEDQPIYHSDGAPIPCLELKHRVAKRLLQRYEYLRLRQGWIPCQDLLQEVPGLTWINWMERLLVERIEQKTERIRDHLETNRFDWENTLYQSFAESLGMSVNAEPFRNLARLMPIVQLRKYRHSLFQLEALLFGMAGMLHSSFTDAYPQRLYKEFQFLRTKHQLQPLSPAVWKFGRLRPANFPTLRIAQLAAFLVQWDYWMDSILQFDRPEDYYQLLQPKVSAYWEDHYLFDRPASKTARSLGKSTIHQILINAICPLLFLYGQYKNELRYQGKAIRILEQLPPEKNHVIREWENLQVEAKDAAQSQALLFLKKHYCNQYRCLECMIGQTVIRSDSAPDK
jgi:hypothetical protein